MRFGMIGLVLWMVSGAAGSSEFRLFCESADDELPHFTFDFYPDDEIDPVGSAVLSLDRGLVLDLKQYNNLVVEVLDDVVRIEYPDGSIEFDNTDEFENPGNVKHLGGGIALVEDLYCYRNAGEL